MPITRPGAKPAVAAPAATPAATLTRIISKPKVNGSAGPALVAAPVVPKTATAPAALAMAYETKETVLQVTRRYANAENSEEMLEIRTFATRPGSVSVAAKSRIGSIGQGGEVSVMVTVPCYQEELDDAQAYASEKVGEYMLMEQERLAVLAGPEALAQAGIDTPDLTAEGADEGSTEGVTEAEPVAEGEMTPDDVRAFETEEELLQFCEANDCQIEMSEYSDLDGAKEAVIAFLWADGAEQVEEAPAEEAGDGYTEEELQKMPLADVIAVFPHWNINGGKAPVKARGANDSDHKNRLIAQIMKFQADALAAA